MPQVSPTAKTRTSSIQPHWFGIMAAVGLLLLSVFGLFFVQKPLQETQEVRPEASVSTGTVFVTAEPNSTIQVNQPATIRLAIDTNSLPTTGVQLVFNVHSTGGYQDMTATVLSGSGLQPAYLELEQIYAGAMVGVIALPPGGQQFNTSSATPFFELTFTPTTTGTITLNFDTERSIVTKYGSNPPEDILKIIPSAAYTVAGMTASPSPSPSPTASPTVSPSPSPSASPNVSCNKSCTGNSSCPVNFRCYSIGSESRCRLVTNPTSTTCQTAPDGGLNRGCNEYCADSRECAAGFSCWQNRCRNPENVDSTSCAALTQTQRQRASASCNQSCGSNTDCATNLRCHSGRCRLASNPSSLSCAAATKATVSDAYNNPKGASDGSATLSGAVKPSPTSSPLMALPGENSEVDTILPPEVTAQETLLSLIMNAEYSLPLKVLIAGFILLIIALLAGGFLSRRRKFAELMAQPTPATARAEQPTAAPRVATPPTPGLPPRPSNSFPDRQKVQSAFTGQQSQRFTPPQQQTELEISPPPPRTGAHAGSMIDRIKEKGIIPPKSGDYDGGNSENSM